MSEPTARWTASSTTLPAGRGVQIRLLGDNLPLSYATVVELLQSNAAFRSRFTRTITETPFPACFWEVRPVTAASLHAPFEFVIVDSASLASVRANRQTFARYFADGQSVVEFDNLGGDAALVVPAPLSAESHYPHLMAFLRSAPEAQVHQLWHAVAAAVARRIGTEPLWLSTSGLGVYWLHVRLDSVPKYYTFTPYRSPAA